MHIAHISEAANCCCETDGSVVGGVEGGGAMNDVVADNDNSVPDAIPATLARNRATNQSTPYYNSDQQLKQVANDVLLLQKVPQHGGGMPLSQDSDAILARIISHCTGAGSNSTITQQATAAHQNHNDHASTSIGPSGLFDNEKWNAMTETQERHHEDSTASTSSQY